MDVKVEKSSLEDVLIVSHQVFEDSRGFFMEVFHQDFFRKAGLPSKFVQLNHSRSSKGVLHLLGRDTHKSIQMNCYKLF
jgi:dTDP-4-dehydrorhamnose 3,5-epimerase